MGMWYNGDAKVQYFSDVVTNEKAILSLIMRRDANDMRGNLLSSAITKYVLADLYDPDNIIIYDIVDGICCTMRDYEVTAVFSNDGKEAAITNTGHMLDP